MEFLLCFLPLPTLGSPIKIPSVSLVALYVLIFWYCAGNTVFNVQISKCKFYIAAWEPPSVFILSPLKSPDSLLKHHSDGDVQKLLPLLGLPLRWFIQV